MNDSRDVGALKQALQGKTLRDVHVLRPTFRHEPRDLAGALFLQLDDGYQVRCAFDAGGFSWREVTTAKELEDVHDADGFLFSVRPLPESAVLAGCTVHDVVLSAPRLFQGGGPALCLHLTGGASLTLEQHDGTGRLSVVAPA